MIVPGLYEIDGKGRSLVAGEIRAVKTHAGPRILWRQADCNCVLDTIGHQGANRIGDERLPITHANVHRHTQFACQKFRLLQREFG